MPHKPPRGFKVTTFLDEATWRAMDARCQATDRSYSYFLRLAVKKALECEECPVKSLRSGSSPAALET